MTTQDNKDISRRFLEELWNQKNETIIDELIADTYINHTPPPQQGEVTLKGLFQELQQGFSGISATIEDQIAEDDKVMTLVTWKCTRKSANAASQITVVGVGVDRIQGGKIVENWNTLDILYRLLNLLDRAVPQPPPPPAPVPLRAFAVAAAPPPACVVDSDCLPGYACQFGACNRV
jgi:predicted SnoaL-like aldol condensation-catalyzing enzyme